MQTFTVHEPPKTPADPADRIDRAERLVFIREGFSWGAALFGPLWMLMHRLWWPLAGYMLVYGSLEMLRTAEIIDERWIGLGMVALHLLLGFEGDTLRRWYLGRRGWHTLGFVNGRNQIECEQRFFDAWLPTQPTVQAQWAPARGSRFSRWPLIGALVAARN
jgi:hypothetical protein